MVVQQHVQTETEDEVMATILNQAKETLKTCRKVKKEAERTIWHV